MYSACRDLYDTAAVRMRKGDVLAGRLLLNRMADCARTGDCPHKAECRDLNGRLTELADAA